jgi:uncharacterized protein
MEFEWDDTKAASNETKHGVTFDDAARVFGDPEHVVVDTTRHLDFEARFKAVGLFGNRLVTVVFTRRGEVFRIISVRPSNPKEVKLYGNR